MKPRILSTARLSVPLASALAAMLAAPAVHAVNLYWDGNGTGTSGAGNTPSGTWGTDVFWTTDSTGADIGPAVLTDTTTALDDVFFSAGTDATGAYAIGLNAAAQSARLVTFEEGTATLSNGTLALAAGGGITVLAGSGDPIISSDISIAGRSTVNVGSGRILTLNTGTFTRGTRAALNIQGAGTVDFTMLGITPANDIVGPWASFGTGTSTKYANSTGNILTGLTGTPAATAADVTDTGGTFNYDVADGGTLGTSASINTLRYTGIEGTLATDTSFTTKGIMNAGSGLLTFSDAVTAGANNTEIVVNAASAGVTFNGIFTGAINKTGSGTMTLSGTPQHNISIWTVNEGILVLNSANVPVTNVEVIPGGTVNSGGTARLAAGNRVSNGAIFTINAGGTLDLNGQGDLIGGLSGAGSVITGTGTPTFSLGNATQTFSGIISGGLNLRKRNGGEQILTGANTFTGTTAVISPGTTATLTLGNSLALQNSALDTTTTVAGTATTGMKTTVDTLILGGLIGNKDLASVFRTDSTGGPLGDIALGGYSGVTALTLNPATGVTRTYTAIIADGATGMTLTKTGAGTQVLSGPNSYTGGTTVTAGILSLTLDTALAEYTTAGKVVFAGGTISAVMGNGTTGWSTAQVETLLANATKTSGALGIDTTAASVSFAPTSLSGAIGLTKLGTNTLTLTSANTHTGNTTITTTSGGTLRLENTGAVQNSAVVSINNRILEVATDTPFSGPTISMNGGTIVSDRLNSGPGITHAFGNLSASHATQSFTAGTNATGTTAAIQVASMTVGSGSGGTTTLNPTTADLIIVGNATGANTGTSTFNLGGTSQGNSIGGAIENGTRTTQNVTKSNTSTWTLNGVNTYTGNTTVNDGTLTLSNAASPSNANTGNDASTVTISDNGTSFLNLTYAGTDVVAKLFIGAVEKLPGVYGSDAIVVPGVTGIPQIKGSGTLTVGAGFSSWITGTFEGGATVPPSQQGPNADPDNDGIRNLVEYAIAGQDPTVPNPTIGIFTGTSLSFSKRQPLATDITYAIEESIDLGIGDDWTEVTGGTYVNDSDDISYGFTPGTPAKNFFRLQVISN